MRVVIGLRNDYHSQNNNKLTYSLLFRIF